jgi:hypothetical protein
MSVNPWSHEYRSSHEVLATLLTRGTQFQTPAMEVAGRLLCFVGYTTKKGPVEMFVVANGCWI